MGKTRRDVIVAKLREAGRDEDADRAERELPERVDTDRMQGKLRSLGLREGNALGTGFSASSGGIGAGGGDWGMGGDGGGS